MGRPTIRRVSALAAVAVLAAVLAAVAEPEPPPAAAHNEPSVPECNNSAPANRAAQPGGVSRGGDLVHPCARLWLFMSNQRYRLSGPCGGPFGRLGSKEQGEGPCSHRTIIAHDSASSPLS